ncbi:MAG: hypothetical protein Q8933_12595 [Bacteroidota bacterium]|nr:hypothetical protein [Bacteroidota bacterium]MDP4195201.1 hypothetical protein [Bacteroidota bacterium]
MNTSSEFTYLTENLDTFLSYMKEKYPLYNNSNVFLRDIQYAIKHFFERKNVKLTYRKIDVLSEQLIKLLESKNIFIKGQENTWKLNLSNPENVTN